jgi:competence protein ComEA
MSLTLRDRGALAAGVLGLLALSMGGWLLISPVLSGDPLATEPFDDQASFVETPTQPAATPPGELIIDVQGGVARPGLVVLAGGARVADAIAAAGGYAPSADLLASASSINLAAPVSDGQQVYVPLAGVAGGPASGGGDGSGEGGLVNLNTASPEALEALPGIGPVTVQKIVAARAERPFASLEELVERKVLNRGQLDDVRELVTV